MVVVFQAYTCDYKLSLNCFVLCGKDIYGKTIILYSKGFQQYFYVPFQYFASERIGIKDPNSLKDLLNSLCQNTGRGKGQNLIISIEIVKARKNIYNYSGKYIFDFC